MRRSVILLAITSTAIAQPAKDPYAAWRDPIAKIVGGAYDGKAYDQLLELTDTIGGRVSGTPRYDQAVVWATAQLKAAGAQNVHTELFTFEHGWQRGTTRAVITSPAARPLHAESLGWAPSTQPGGLKAQVAIVEPAAPIPTQVKGRLAVVDRSKFPDGPRGWLGMRKLLSGLADAGAAGALIYGTTPNNVVAASKQLVGGKVFRIPLAALGSEDGKAVARLAARGPVTIELSITNTITTGPVQIANVVGELVGKDKPDEWILVGAHLDSWDLGTGAEDNGAGAIEVIQTARLLAAAGPLRRTVRFALWGGEEQGGIGSRAYVAKHAGELVNCIATLNSDSGPGHVAGWIVSARKDVQATMSPIADALLSQLGAPKLDLALTADSDHFSFVQAGIPTLDLLVDTRDYDTIIHRSGDTIDKVDSHALGSGLAVIAVTAYVLARSTTRLGPRLDHKALDAMFKPEGIDELLKADGWW